MDRKTISSYVRRTGEAARKAVSDHAAVVYELEAGLGFNLDVATDVYGLELFDPDEAVAAISQRWAELLIALHGDDTVLLIAHQFTEPRPGCRGFGGDPGADHHTRITFVQKSPHTKVDYKKGDDPADSQIVLTGAKTAVVCTSSAHPGTPTIGVAQPVRHITWSSGDILLATQSRPQPGFLPLDNWRFNAGLLGCDSSVLPIAICAAEDLTSLGRQLEHVPLQGAGHSYGFEALATLSGNQP